MNNLELLAQLQRSLETMPSHRELAKSAQWLGNARALLNAWDRITATGFPSTTLSSHPTLTRNVHQKIESLLNQAISDIRLNSEETTNFMLGVGQSYDFYNVIRKILGKAEREVFFIDNYLNADFVERYFPLINDNVNIKLLTANNRETRTLESAIDAYTTQNEHNFTLEIKKTNEVHDRYLITDKESVFHSSGSFKDGANKKPITLIEVKDLSSETRKIYNQIWDKIEATKTPLS